MQVLSLLIGGGMALQGRVTAQQLTTFVLYVEFVTYASLNVCDQVTITSTHRHEIMYHV